MKKIWLLIPLFMLAACTSKPVWIKGGASTADFGTDKYACMQGSMNAAPTVAGTNAYGRSSSNPYASNGVFAANTHDINAATRDQMFSACMQSKGWIFGVPPKASPFVPNAEVTLQKLSAGTLNNPRIVRAAAEAKKCKQDKKDGIYANNKEVAECANIAVTSGFTEVGYPYMDLINSLNEQRMKDAIAEDAKKMTEGESKLAMKKKMSEVVEDEISRKNF